jgi:glycosyltransferase involved in cell wall biosynthesis
MSLSLVEQVRRARIPAVAFVCDDWLHYARMSDAWIRMFAGRRTLGRTVDWLTGLPTHVDWDGAAVYVFLSEFLRHQSPWLRRTVVEHPGIDAEFQIARPVRPWAGRLFTLGRMDPRKGFATAIEALASLPEATLTIAGGGPQAEISRLREVAAGHGVGERVTWLGPQERAALPDLYAAHDAVLFPVVWEEPFGLVPLEAMGIGRPVIATGRGGSGEYLRDGENCLLHPAQDSVALTDAIRRLQGDEVLRARLREGGLVTASRLTSDRYARAAVDHLRAAVRSSS